MAEGKHPRKGRDVGLDSRAKKNLVITSGTKTGPVGRNNRAYKSQKSELGSEASAPLNLEKKAGKKVEFRKGTGRRGVKVRNRQGKPGGWRNRNLVEGHKNEGNELRERRRVFADLCRGKKGSLTKRKAEKRAGRMLRREARVFGNGLQRKHVHISDRGFYKRVGWVAEGEGRESVS